MSRPMSEHVIIHVNGDERRLKAGSTIADLLGSLGLVTGKVAVERNREVVPASLHAVTPLHEHDVVEIVHFVGGG